MKVHRYMICGVVATSISGCDVCTACRVVCESHTIRHTVVVVKGILMCVLIFSTTFSVKYFSCWEEFSEVLS